MTRRAGLALNIVFSLVAGLLSTVIFISPGTVKRPGPFLPTVFLICSEMLSMTAAACLREMPAASAAAVRISPLVGPFAFPFAAMLLLLLLGRDLSSS